jgi:hypothetical protein
MVDYLAGLRLNGSERVLGALAIALAEDMENAPGYAKTKFVHELRGILADLREAETKPEKPRPARGAEALSKALEKHVERALAALEEISIRELEATADALRLPRGGPQLEFASVFRAAAENREGATWARPTSDLEAAITKADDQLAEIIEDAPHPFWQAVRKAVEAR